MSKFSTIRFETTMSHDEERAVFVVFEKGEIVNTYKQLQGGTKRTECITNKYHKAAYSGITVITTPDQYKDLCKMHRH